MKMNKVQEKGKFYYQGNFYNDEKEFFLAASVHMKKHLDEEEIKKYMDHLAKEIWLNLKIYGKCLTVKDLYHSNLSRYVHLATGEMVNIE